MRCLNCHYSLAHLPERRCPECGREFDPADPRTFSTDLSLRWDRHARGVIVGAAVFCLALIAVAVYLDGLHMLVFGLFLIPIAIASGDLRRQSAGR